MRMTLSKLCYKTVALAFIIALAACKPSVPSEYIQPDDMEDILYDYYIAKAMSDQRNEGHNSENNRVLYYYGVLKKHGITEAEFDSSMVYYYKRADKLRKIYRNVQDRMTADANKLGANVGEVGKYSQYSATGDTANIWRNSTSTVLTPSAPYNRMDFTVDVDTTFRTGDSFLMNFMSDFKYQSGTKEGVVYIAVTFSNDSIAGYSATVSRSGVTQLRVPANNKYGIKAMTGFIFLGRGRDNSSTLKLLFVNNIQLIRFHKKEEEKEAVDVNRPRPEKIQGKVPVPVKVQDTVIDKKKEIKTQVPVKKDDVKTQVPVKKKEEIRTQVPEKKAEKK